MDGTEVTMWLMVALAILFGILVLATMLHNRQRRQSLRSYADSLRLLVAQAETWVETKPTSKEAEDNLKRARRILDVIDDGLRRGTHPLLMLQFICSDPGCELAISARFKAMHDKKM